MTTVETRNQYGLVLSRPHSGKPRTVWFATKAHRQDAAAGYVASGYTVWTKERGA